MVLKCTPDGNKQSQRNGQHSFRKLLFLSKSTAIVLALEVMLCILMSITFIFEAFIHGLLPGASIYGYTVVACPTSAIAWLFCMYLVQRERYNILYGLQHSIPVIMFWLTSLLWLAIAVASINSSEWWWHLTGHIDVVDLVVFSVRACVILLLLFVGVVRPFFSRPARYRLLVNMDVSGEGVVPPPISSQSEEDQIKAGGFSRKSSTGSTFGNLFKKAKQIFPFVWPKGHLFLQLQVVICLIILGAGRVINVYVPIYYKIIIDALTPSYNVTSKFDLSIRYHGSFHWHHTAHCVYIHICVPSLSSRRISW